MLWSSNVVEFWRLWVMIRKKITVEGCLDFKIKSSSIVWSLGAS